MSVWCGRRQQPRGTSLKRKELGAVLGLAAMEAVELGVS
jgi:hypothetical protein